MHMYTMEAGIVHHSCCLAPIPLNPPFLPELEAARPQTVGEEELQLQLALAMSKEEAEQEEQKKRSDDVRLQMAITQSEEDFKYVWHKAHTWLLLACLHMKMCCVFSLIICRSCSPQSQRDSSCSTVKPNFGGSVSKSFSWCTKRKLMLLMCL